VIITLRPGAAEKGRTYAAVLAEARERIDLGALGLGPMRMRLAATGARVLEVPGADRAAKADSLAARLREVFEGDDDIRVSRPIITADLMITGMDDSVTAREVVGALAKVGGCPAESISAGQMKVGRYGMGTVYLRCPVEAARKVASEGRLLVGWSAARVTVLETRPPRCHRCLALGHVRAQCSSEVDRSDECYRCGQKGHVARGCAAPPHCTRCAAAGKKADHLAGSKACAKLPAKPKGGNRRAPATVEATARPPPAQPQSAEGVGMEVN